MKITKAITMFGAVVALCAVFAASASAQCGLTMKRNQGTLAAVSTMAGLNANTTLAPSAPAQNGEEQTLVGFWDIKFIAGNQIVDEGFDQFHFYTLNQADLTYAACRILGMQPVQREEFARAAQ